MYAIPLDAHVALPRMEFLTVFYSPMVLLIERPYLAVLSNLVSNVPAVMLLRLVVPNLVDPERGWLTLAMSSPLAGNLTLLGSVANLIVAEVARRQHVTLSFWEYLKTGVPITILTLMWGAF